MNSLPPVANKVEHVMEMFGDVRVDNYYWLRDDTRSDPDVLSYLLRENNYAESIMSETKKFEEEIYAEMKARIKEDDISAPVRKGSYYYYKRSFEGKDYVQYCRRFIPNNDASPSVNDTMPTGPDAPPEHVIIDVEVDAQDDTILVSPNNKLVAHNVSKSGTVYVIDAETKALVGNPIEGSCDIAWAGAEALVYITWNKFSRRDKVWLHKLGEEQSLDLCLYHEKDDSFTLNLVASESEKFLFVQSKSKNTGSVFYLDVSQPEKLGVLTPRVAGVDTFVSHRGNHFFIKRSEDFFNSELLACPVDNTSETMVLIPHRESVQIEDIQLFTDHLVVYEREEGLPKITTYRLPAIGEPLQTLQGGRSIDLIDPLGSNYVDKSKSQFSSSILRCSFSSMRMPCSVYDYDMNTGVYSLKKILTVMGGFDVSNYVTERKWAYASDGTKIPISIVYRKSLVKFDGSNPLLLYGYGSYERCEDPSFQASRITLLDRGFIYAIAHIRGGGEMGKQWYINGKFLKKKNTFTDFIACAEYLIESKYCSKEKLCIEGTSAGGLLIGAVLNMRPDLFKVAVAEVPFLDALTTMLDPSLPLTTLEWEEWGNPQEEQFYLYIKSYSPVDNVKAQNYPNILIRTGFEDSVVYYSESAKYVAKLRDMKTDDNLLLFKCEFGAGHEANPGRFGRLQEDAFKYTFILKALNMIPASGSEQS